jgi:hypothetical protein
LATTTARNTAAATHERAAGRAAISAPAAKPAAGRRPKHGNGVELRDERREKCAATK